jgi:hypothetical protein
VSTTDTAEGEVHIAGNAIYAVFENVALAVSAATNALARADDWPSTGVISKRPTRASAVPRCRGSPCSSRWHTPVKSCCPPRPSRC